MRAASDCRPPPTARHASSQPRSSTSHPPQQKDAVHRKLRPSKGKGRRTAASVLRRGAALDHLLWTVVPNKALSLSPATRVRLGVGLGLGAPYVMMSSGFYSQNGR